MINFEQAKVSFKKYLQDYDLEYGKIELKIRHTYGVVNASEYIAKKLLLDNENIELAKLIVLLHDIGRFEQIKQYDCFIDNKNIDTKRKMDKIRNHAIQYIENKLEEKN